MRPSRCGFKMLTGTTGFVLLMVTVIAWKSGLLLAYCFHINVFWKFMVDSKWLKVQISNILSIANAFKNVYKFFKRNFEKPHGKSKLGNCLF